MFIPRSSKSQIIFSRSGNLSHVEVKKKGQAQYRMKKYFHLDTYLQHYIDDIFLSKIDPVGNTLRVRLGYRAFDLVNKKRKRENVFQQM